MPASFSVDQVNAFLWKKQHLAPGVSGKSVSEIVEDVVGLHATSPTTPYLSLRARMSDFQPSQLEDALYRERSVIKVLCMRQTVHVIPVSHLAHVLAATGNRLRRSSWSELVRLVQSAHLAPPGEEKIALAGLKGAVERHLAQAGSATAAELADAVPDLQRRVHYAPDKPYGGVVSVGSMLLPRLTASGLIVRGRTRGTWRSNLHEYALLRDWLPGGDPVSVPAEVAQPLLLRSYLAAFGPATLEDAAWWAGWSKSETSRAVSALGVEAASLSVDGSGSRYWALARDVPLLEATRVESSQTVRMLPSLDGYIMGYQDRRRFLAPEHARQVFDRSGNAYSTVWLDGRVVGIWREMRDSVECFLWNEDCCQQVTSEALALDQFLRRADGRDPREDLVVHVRSCPAGLYVKTPFTPCEG
jgi:hypothetical protein